MLNRYLSTGNVTNIYLIAIDHPWSQSALDEATEPWGVKVERVEVNSESESESDFDDRKRRRCCIIMIMMTR